MSREPWVGLSLMPTDDFRRAALPLFADALVEGLQWSFDMGDEPEWATPLLDAYEKSGRLSGHGVHLGMLSGDWSERQRRWMRDMEREVSRRHYARVSEHFGFAGGASFEVAAPLPIPRSEATIALGRNRMKHFAALARTEVGMENLAFAFGKEEALEQGAFIDALLGEVDGFVLLDLHNLYCQVVNFEIDPLTLLESYPLERVKELHVSGGSTSISSSGRSVRRDTHDAEVPAAVFEMTALALQRCPNLEAIVFERLGNTIASPAEEEQFRGDYRRLRALRDQWAQPMAESRARAPSRTASAPEIPTTDAALAALQARLLSTFHEQSEAEAIMASLRASSECEGFQDYLETFDFAMVEVAALLTKTWGRKR
jgi:uncharacterized protein (UPF0276 family)